MPQSFTTGSDLANWTSAASTFRGEVSKRRLREFTSFLDRGWTRELYTHLSFFLLYAT